MFVRSALVICLRPRTGSDCTPKAHDHQGLVSCQYVGYLLHFKALQASSPARDIWSTKEPTRRLGFAEDDSQAGRLLL